MTAHVGNAAPLATLRRALLESGYQDPAPAARYLRSCFSDPSAVPAAVREHGPGGALGGQLDLFAYGAELDDPAATRALAPATPQSLARSGILQRHRGRWRSRMSIGGHGDVFVFGDLPRRAERRDHVDGVTAVADLARRLTMPADGGRLLDLGTGSGIHALLAARAGDSAVGADINPHALRLAAASAELSAVEGVQWRQGSWYEPVAGERFDRIVCVAPYVVSPDSEFTFRDGDSADVDPVRTVAAGARAHLAPGGSALVFVCWGHGVNEDWRRAPMRWVSPRGSDVLLARLSQIDPVRYALEWNRPPMRTLGPAAHDEVMGRWLDHYARERFERISFGALCIRRRARAGATGIGRVGVDALGVTGESAGAQLKRALTNLECLAERRDDDALLALAPAVPEGQRVEQRLQHDGERYRLRRAAIRQADGLGLHVDVTAQVLEAIYRLDGRRTVRQVLTDLGVGRGAAARRRTAETAQAMRELLQVGLLELTPTA